MCDELTPDQFEGMIDHLTPSEITSAAIKLARYARRLETNAGLHTKRLYINGGVYTREQLICNGWTDAQIKASPRIIGLKK